MKRATTITEKRTRNAYMNLYRSSVNPPSEYVMKNENEKKKNEPIWKWKLTFNIHHYSFSIFLFILLVFSLTFLQILHFAGVVTSVVSLALNSN